MGCWKSDVPKPDVLLSSVSTVRNGLYVLMDILETKANMFQKNFRDAIRENRQKIHNFFQNMEFFWRLLPRLWRLNVQDETKFRQILGNLIKNAIHHRKERITITMSGKRIIYVSMSPTMVPA